MDPVMHSTQPITPSAFSFSPSRKCASTALHKGFFCPREQGVTRCRTRATALQESTAAPPPPPSLPADGLLSPCHHPEATPIPHPHAHTPDEDAERAQGGDEDGRGVGIGCKISKLPQHHAEEAGPP